MPENPPFPTHPDSQVRAMQAMKRVGNFAGQALYYAAHNEFAQPGLHYWNGKENVWLCDEPRELPAVAARWGASFDVWPDPMGGTILGNAYAKAALQKPLPGLEPQPNVNPNPNTHTGTHVFQGVPDSRQSLNHLVPLSRFRPRYRALSDVEKALHDDIKRAADELLSLYEKIMDIRASVTGIDERQIKHNSPTGIPPAVPQRDLALATTSLEDSVMRAIRALTAAVPDA